MPFPENYFDIVLSSWAVHNLEAKEDRKKALDEMIRVLKPNGMVILIDVEHQVEYAKYFELRGMTNIQPAL
ncbi:class I SAM-dependent methyltransferase [Cyanobacteria bacterium FACHB-63]|nr:class I SAM-dependent methyltransferase [Cyanobacteria bacterium FACHB-63]